MTDTSKEPHREPIIASPDILERIKGALNRFRDQSFSMRVPVDPTDIDVVLCDASTEIKNLRAALPPVSAPAAVPSVDSASEPIYQVRETRSAGRPWVDTTKEWAERCVSAGTHEMRVVCVVPTPAHTEAVAPVTMPLDRQEAIMRHIIKHGAYRWQAGFDRAIGEDNKEDRQEELADAQINDIRAILDAPTDAVAQHAAVGEATVVQRVAKAEKPSPDKDARDECEHAFEPFKSGYLMCINCHQVQHVEYLATTTAAPHPRASDALNLGDLVERLALKHIAPNAKAMFPDKDYRETEQFRRVMAYTEALLAASPAAPQEPIYQTGWPSPESQWGDVPKEAYDKYTDFGYTRRRIVYAAPLAADSAAPAGVRKLTDEQLDELSEGREIIENMVSSIQQDGNYSTEATLTFLRQALQCLPLLAARAATPEASK